MPTTNPLIASLLPLPHLPNPARSLSLLQRLSVDPGILHAMRTHNFRVGTLREMEPIGATTATSRTLGLNHNRGEIIDLRLRTDAYDGYRDYKTIRETLCHELAHNVFGEHDAKFWELCGRIEKEVERNDYWSGGRPLTDEVFYEPPVKVEEEKKKTVVGGTYRLGGGGGGGSGAAGGGMREVLARAAEERRRRGAAA